MKFNDFRNTNVHLQEEMAFLKSAKRIFKNIVSKLSSFKWGQKASFTFSIPVPLGEEVLMEKQTGKPGGEYVEFVVIDRLYKSFIQSFPKVTIKVDYDEFNYEQFKKGPYKTALNALKQNAKNNQTIVRWMKAGLAGAKSIDASFRKGHPEVGLFEITLQQTGKILTGKEKADVIIHVEKIGEKEFIESIKLSLKASEAEPWIFNGTQSGGLALLTSLVFGTAQKAMEKAWRENDPAMNDFSITPEMINGKYDKVGTRQAIAAQLIERTGVTSKEIEEFNRVDKEMDQILGDISRELNQTDVAKERKIVQAKWRELNKEKKKVETASKKEQDDAWNANDKLVKQKVKKDDPARVESQKILDNARAIHKKNTDKYKSLINPLKKRDRELFELQRAKIRPLEDYRRKLYIPWGDILFEGLKGLAKNKKTLFIRSIFNFSGAETGLDYLIVGCKEQKITTGYEKGKKSTRGFVDVNTLQNPNFKPTIEKFFNEMINELDVNVIRYEPNSIGLEVTAPGYKKPVLMTQLYRDSNNVRMKGFNLKSMLASIDQVDPPIPSDE